MKSFLLPTLATAVMAAVAALAVGAAPDRAGLDSAAAAHLAALQQAPESTGELIYRGAVYEQHSAGGPQLFSYERRVGATAHGQTSAHITQAPTGEVIIAEQARFGPGYALQRFDAVNRQQGYSGSVTLSRDGRHLDYRLQRNGKLSTATEDVTDPVVSGPSLHGFIVHHWDALSAGQTLPVRMIVMSKQQTYGFHIRRLAPADGRTTFTITPSNLAVRLLVAPLTVSFDSATRNVLRYEGRVPPMKGEAGKLKELDARVDYTMFVPTYR